MKTQEVIPKTQAERTADYRKTHNLKKLELWIPADIVTRYKSVYQSTKDNGLLPGVNPSAQFLTLLLDAFVYPVESVTTVQQEDQEQEVAAVTTAQQEDQLPPKPSSKDLAATLMTIYSNPVDAASNAVTYLQSIYTGIRVSQQEPKESSGYKLYTLAKDTRTLLKKNSNHSAQNCFCSLKEKT